jgi:septal ring factor EnvC (AmiA/AmiB activator)
MANGIEQTVIVIVTGAFAIFAIWLSRRLSSEVEERVQKMKEMRKQMDSLERELAMKHTIIGEKDREIQSLKSKLEEKDKKIEELQERIKFAEKVSERDLERIRDRISEIQANLQSIIKTAQEKERKKK